MQENGVNIAAAPGKRLYELDIMRAIAIGIIIFHHLPDFTFNFFDLRNFGINMDLSPLNRLNAYFGLGLFVYISGVLMRNSYSEMSRPGKVWEYLKKRFFRIFPLYWVALALFAVLSDAGARRIIIQALGFQLVFSTPGFQPIFTIWYIGLITVYYWQLILIAKAKNNAALRIVAILSLPSTLILLRAAFGMGDARLILYYFIFLSGLAGDHFYSVIISSYKKIAGLAVFFILSVFAFTFIFLIPFLYRDFYQPYALMTNGDNFFISLPMTGCIAAIALINCIAVSFAWLVRLAAYKAVRFAKYFTWLAYSSYCIYLFHRPVWLMLLNLHYPDGPKARLLYLGSLGIALTLISAYAVQKGYDRLLLWAQPGRQGEPERVLNSGG